MKRGITSIRRKRDAGQYGFELHEISTTMEYIRRPVGNPVQQTNREIIGRLAAVPIHHEIVLSWAMKNPNLDDTGIINSLRNKLGSVTSYGGNLDFVEKYYPKALEYTFSDIRETVENNILRFCAPMTKQEEGYFEKWDTEMFKTGKLYAEGALNFKECLKELS